ncbi:hypothetical protein AWC05_28270 [Mycobacterium florentinum]|uniref:Resuscitation-promoting factor RpfA n=1 Tax=Mycobacterium florentinum TaxID=292462 RepID=A0A1X1U3Q6_MYCFL|nr:hypothetical protein AWC05_28270 [Mycobacterium florentinum]
MTPPPADAMPPADAPPPADALPPAPPADAPPPAEAVQQATKVGYTQKLWEAIRGEDVNGNDALDSLAQPAPVN